MHHNYLLPHFIVLPQSAFPPHDPPDGVSAASTVTSTSTSSYPVCSLAPTNHTSALFPVPITSSPRLFRISAALSLSLSAVFWDSDGRSSMLCPISFGWMRGLCPVASVSDSARLHCEQVGSEGRTLVLPLGPIVLDRLMVGLLAFCHEKLVSMRHIGCKYMVTHWFRAQPSHRLTPLGCPWRVLKGWM